VKVRELLRRNPVLAMGSDAVIDQVAKASEVEVYDKGAMLTRAGAAQTHVLVIASGRCELYRKDREAGTQMLTGIIEAPAIFGDAELYGASPWIVSTRAVAETIAVRIPNAAFDKMISSDLKIAAALYRETCARHLLAIEIMQVFALQKSQNKILRLLHSFARTDESGERAARVSQVQLARALGLNAKTIQRHLASLEKEGLIRRDGERVVIEAKSGDFMSLRGGLGAKWMLPDDD
jgi:CRP-like cAMP-binding protein